MITHPIFVHVKHWAKVGRGLIRRIITFPCDDKYQPSNTTRVHDLCTVWWAKFEKNNKVRHNMTAVSTVCICFFSSNIYVLHSGRGGHIHETKLPMQDLELNVRYLIMVSSPPILHSQQLSILIRVKQIGALVLELTASLRGTRSKDASFE